MILEHGLIDLAIEDGVGFVVFDINHAYTLLVSEQDVGHSGHVEAGEGQELKEVPVV